MARKRKSLPSDPAREAMRQTLDQLRKLSQSPRWQELRRKLGERELSSLSAKERAEMGDRLRKWS